MDICFIDVSVNLAFLGVFNYLFDSVKASVPFLPSPTPFRLQLLFCPFPFFSFILPESGLGNKSSLHSLWVAVRKIAYRKSTGQV